MPAHCCVPLCTKKNKRDQDTGEKVSFFRLPDDVNLRKQWLHAIRRDVGPNFSIKEGTRVCSRHFKAEDLKRSLTSYHIYVKLCNFNSPQLLKLQYNHRNSPHHCRFPTCVVVVSCERFFEKPSQLLLSLVINPFILMIWACLRLLVLNCQEKIDGDHYMYIEALKASLVHNNYF